MGQSTWLICYPSFIRAKHLLLPDQCCSQFSNVEVDSVSLVLGGLIIFIDLLGLLVAAFYLRLWGSTRAKMGQQVEVGSFCPVVVWVME